MEKIRTIKRISLIRYSDGLKEIFRYVLFMLLAGTVLLSSCNNNVPANPPTGKNFPAIHPLSVLFKNGTHNAIVTYYKDLTAEQEQVLKKIFTLLRTNSNLEKELDQLLQDPESIQKLKIPGLTKKETETFLTIFESQETSSQQASVSITSDENQIFFDGNDRLSVLDSLTLNLKDSSVTFKQYQLDHYTPDSSYATNDFMPAGERLNDISVFSGPSGILNLLPTSNRYTLVLGRLNKSGKTYMYLVTTEPMSNNPYNLFYSIIID